MLHPGRSRKQDPGGNEGDNLIDIGVYILTLHDYELWNTRKKPQNYV